MCIASKTLTSLHSKSYDEKVAALKELGYSVKQLDEKHMYWTRGVRFEVSRDDGESGQMFSSATEQSAIIHAYQGLIVEPFIVSNPCDEDAEDDL